jgi:hypothetical protein
VRLFGVASITATARSAKLTPRATSIAARLPRGPQKKKGMITAAVQITITALGTEKRLFLKSWCLLQIMRLPFKSRLSAMKTNPKAKAPSDSEHNVRRKTFICLSEGFLLLQSSWRSPLKGERIGEPRFAALCFRQFVPQSTQALQPLSDGISSEAWPNIRIDLEELFA